MKKQLKELTKEEWDVLEGMGMLWELYPDAPATYWEMKIPTEGWAD